MGWQDRHTVVPAVYLVLRRDGKVLLARRFNTGYQDGNYSLPAGHLDGGETARQALARETKEEINVAVGVDDLRLLHVMHRKAEEGNHERVDFFFEATAWQGEPQIMEANKCDDLQWFDMASLPENTVEVVEQALRMAADGEPYSEAGF
jgi:ADP-ribose pyrophosphatase YjhB (NUDIX family)